MRTLTIPNAPVKVDVMDDPGPGGAPHKYQFSFYQNGLWQSSNLRVEFQSGPVDKLVNGVTHEALLAILIDRLRCFQAGPCPCRHNDMALGHLEEALLWLNERTRDRVERGVVGKVIK